MENSSKIQKIIQEIRDSYDRWRLLYNSNWGENSKYNWLEGTEFWDKPCIQSQLPASKKQKFYYFTPKRVCSILQSRDGEFALNHTVTLLSLLENLVKKITNEEKLTRDKFIEFLENPRTEPPLPEEQKAEFLLAIATRDCVVHNGSQVNKKWQDVYGKARKESCAAKGYTLGYHLNEFATVEQVEKWHDMFMEITNKIEANLSLSKTFG